MKTQYGRTLVEILGALALIGALTFIGVESYKILYAKHQANEAFESVQCQMLELDLLDLERIDLDEDITSDACENDSGVEIKVVRTEMEGEDGGEISSGYYVELTDLTPEACRQVLSKPWETEFEIAVGCEGRTFNPDEPDYSVCDIFDEDYEPECLEEYIEEDIGEVSLLDNALPSDSIFHKILGISNAYARYDGTTVRYKNGKWIRIYRQVQTVVDASCPRELRTAARTCCPKRATPYFNGLFSGCCYTGSDGTYTFDQDDFAGADKKIIGEADTLTIYNVLFRIRSDITVKKDIKEKKKDGPSEFVELPLQDCCVGPAVRDIYDANGTWSGTKYCCERYETEGMSKECKEWYTNPYEYMRWNLKPPKGCNVKNLEYFGGKSSWDTDSDELYEKYKENAEKYTKGHPPFPQGLELANYFFLHFSKEVIQKKEPQPPALLDDKEAYKKSYAAYSHAAYYKNERPIYERFVKAFGEPDLRYLDDDKDAWVLWKGIIPRDDLIRRYEAWWDQALTDYGIPPENRTINIGGKLYPTTMSLIHYPGSYKTFSYEQKEHHSLSDNPKIITEEAESVFSTWTAFSHPDSPHHLFIVSNSWQHMIASWRKCEELDYASDNFGLNWRCDDDIKEALKFNAATLYLHEIGHGVDKLASKRKEGLNVGLDSAMEIILTEIRSRLIEYQKLYQIVSAKMRACAYNYDSAAIDILFPLHQQWMTDLGLFQNIDGSPYDPFKSERESIKQLLQETKKNCADIHYKVQQFFAQISSEGFMPFEIFYDIAQSKGIERAMIEAGLTILDSDLLSSNNSYGGRAANTTPSGKYQATNIDWDSYIRQLPNDDVMSHAGMREILERSTTFWDWVCSTYSYLNPIQCMERQMANRAVKDGLCCDPDSEKLYCAKWKKEDINKDGKNDKLHCEDGLAMCCPEGSVLSINKEGNSNLTAECCSVENVHLTGEIYKEDELDDKEEGIPLSECCISDGMGNCCVPENREGCKCTKTYLYNHAPYQVAKGNVTKDQFINGMVPCEGPFFDDPSLYKEINGEVYVEQYMEGTCPNQDFVKVCDANCSYPYLREREFGYCPCGENQVWNSEQFACLCDAGEGYVWNDDKTKCVRCSYPECFDEDEEGCRSISEYEYKNEDGYCVPCGEDKPVFYGDNGCINGDNCCITCASASEIISEFGNRPYWNGRECVACADDPNSGGVVWDNEYGACVSCYDAYEDETPVWNWSSYSCEPCPEGTVYGQTSDGTWDCIKQETDTSNKERCMHFPETVWDGSRCVYCNEMPSCRPEDGVGCTFESGHCV